MRDISEKILISALPVCQVHKNDDSGNDLMLVHSTMHQCHEVPRMSV